MFLVDIGSSAFTGYEVDKGGFKAADIGDLYDEFPGLEDGVLKNHHIHTHHSMGAFMSGTDWSQMNDRGQIANYFIMLVVDTIIEGSRANHNGWVAHVGFPANLKQTVRSKIEKSDMGIEFANNLDGYPVIDFLIADAEKLVEKEEEKQKTVMCIMEMTIVKEAMDERRPDPFLARYHRVVAAVAEASRTSYSTPTQQPGTRGGYTGTQNTVPAKSAAAASKTARREEKRQRKAAEKQGGKPIMEMTDKEWMAEQEKKIGGPYHFTQRHVHALLNASVDYSIDISRSKWSEVDPIHGLSKHYMDCSLATFEEWADDFPAEMRRWAMSNFEDIMDEEYLELVKLVYNFARAFHYQRWAEILTPHLAIELEAAAEICMDLAGESPIVNQQGLPFPAYDSAHRVGGFGRNFQDGYDGGNWIE